jgi:hypothetical protein
LRLSIAKGGRVVVGAGSGWWDVSDGWPGVYGIGFAVGVRGRQQRGFRCVVVCVVVWCGVEGQGVRIVTVCGGCCAAHGGAV